MSEVKIKIDGEEYVAEDDQTVLEVASENNIDIPTHCYRDPYEPVGFCRLCLVEVEPPGQGTDLQTACTYPVQEGLEVRTDTERVRKARKLTAELLLARCPESEAIQEIAEKLGVDEPRFPPKNLNCSLCGLCVRACKLATGEGEESIINFRGRGPNREIIAPFEVSPEECKGCEACVAICPLDALEMVEIEEE